jgi:hypothetical protein
MIGGIGISYRCGATRAWHNGAGDSLREPRNVIRPAFKPLVRLRNFTKMIRAAGDAFIRFLFRGRCVPLVFLWMMAASVSGRR